MMMKSTRNRIVAAILVAAALFYVGAPLLKPKSTTGSENARFNDWVEYYRRQEGYTVEYHSFDDFKAEVDVVRVKQALEMSEDVVDYKNEIGSVTVYYDGDNDRIFYIGTGTDPSKIYGYYCAF